MHVKCPEYKYMKTPKFQTICKMYKLCISFHVTRVNFDIYFCFLIFIFKVVVGTVTLFKGGTRKYANSVTLHPQYDANTLANDIAMVNTPYIFTSSKYYIHFMY